MISYRFILWQILLILPFAGLSQAISNEIKAISLTNPSFEDIPSISKPPTGWYYCGPFQESPPDIHPYNFFNVTQKAQHGQTYVGMVVRDNNSWEAIGQKLTTPLLAGQCYSFQIFVCKSDTYHSVSRLTYKPADYIQPTKLRLWGGAQNCDALELLGETPIIKHNNWKAYQFTFKPNNPIRNIVLEVYYPDDEVIHNGNILLDRASGIMPVSCEDQNNLEEVISIAEEPPSDFGAWNVFLQEEGTQIKLIADWALESKWIVDSNGFFLYVNPHLWAICSALKQNPNYQLVIGVEKRNKAQYQRYCKIFTTFFRQEGLPEEQYTFKRLKPTKQDRWLWYNPEQGFSFRLQE